MIKKQLQQAIGQVLADLNIEVSDFGLEYPTDFANGDLSSNAAMVHAKISKQNPRVLAEKIVEKLNEQKKNKKLSSVEKIEVAGPGFINFHLSRGFFTKSVAQILKEGGNYGKNLLYKSRKVMVDYTDPNPFKPFHIGHLMSNAIGETVSRLLENAGAEVKRAYYGGDVGLHVAKAIWGMLKFPYNKAGEETPIAYLGRVYAEGNKAFESDAVLADSIKDINKKLFDRSDEEMNRLYTWGRAISIEHFHEIYEKLETRFDFEFFESEMAPIGMFLVEEFLQKGVLEKSEGAIVFKGEKYGLHTRVFVNSQGLPTYEAKELGLTKRKIESYPFDLSIVVTANEQSDYFKVMMKVIEFVFPEIANKMCHISHGMLRFAQGKMSSRKGNVITGESLIHDVRNMVADKISNRELTSDEKKNILDTVAISAIKFSILKQSPGSDIIFDMEKSLSFEGDSGPYLQYSSVRAQSVLDKAQKEGIKPSVKGSGIFGGKKRIPETVPEFEKLLSHFSDIVERATVELAPQHIVTYLLQLSGAFNSYYATNKIVDATDNTSSYKVALTASFVQIMNHGLSLLGISVPEKM
jgi:arginyl-tRNA synthetase